MLALRCRSNSTLKFRFRSNIKLEFRFRYGFELQVQISGVNSNSQIHARVHSCVVCADSQEEAEGAWQVELASAFGWLHGDELCQSVMHWGIQKARELKVAEHGVVYPATMARDETCWHKRATDRQKDKQTYIQTNKQTNCSWSCPTSAATGLIIGAGSRGPQWRSQSHRRNAKSSRPLRQLRQRPGCQLHQLMMSAPRLPNLSA